MSFRPDTTYEVAARKISCAGNEAPLAPVDGLISLHMFVDRRSVDIYGGRGRLYLPVASALSTENHGLKLFCQGGTGRLVSLKVYELKPAWRQ